MRQKITSAATLWVLLSATSLYAADMPEQYILYCKGEKATGFNWRANDWVEVTFNESDYIVVKSPNNKCVGFDEKVDEVVGVLRWKDVCVNIREAGKEYEPYISGKCTEYYPDPSATKWTRSLSCDNLFSRNFSTSFNGWFHRSSVHGDVASRSDDKDSLVIEVGKCSQIN
jgi:hypothetical protein